MSDMERYKRQITFNGLGHDGQRKLLDSRVCIIGTGALGSVIANNLCRAGVGFIRIVDRDFVEEVNLQRQILFSEKDVKDGLPKAEAAYEHLCEINSGIEIEPVTADVNSTNIEKLIKDVDLVVDGTDNFETRFLINEACHKHNVKWVYGGVIGSSGATMNVLYDDGPCFRCFMPDIPEPGSYETCSTVGVLNSVTGIIGSIEASEAMKILIGLKNEINNKYLAIDTWNNYMDFIEIAKNPDCPVCAQGRYEQLNTPKGSYSTNLCGHDAWQVVPKGEYKVDLDAIGESFKKAGEVKITKFALSFSNKDVSFKLFTDGRAIINNVKNESAARNIYAEYIGI